MAVSQDNAALSADADFSQALEQQITQAIQPIFSQALEQQVTQAIQPITQAIQPTLDEFRQRVTQELSGQKAAMPRRDAGTSETGQETPQSTLIPVRNVQQARERPLAGALTSAVHTVGRSSARWLQALLVAGLGALLAESAHATVQQHAEQGLHALLQKAFEAAPAGFANQEILEKVERTLQFILREALDAVFAEGVRASVQQDAQQTIQQSLRGDFGGALKKAEEAPQVLMTALTAVLRRHQKTILRLLLALLLLEVGSALGQSEKSGPGA